MSEVASAKTFATPTSSVLANPQLRSKLQLYTTALGEAATPASLVLFGRALDSYSHRTEDLPGLGFLPEAFAALPDTLLLAIVLAIWARRRMDPQERPLAPQVGGSLALAALYLTGTWLGS